MSMGASAIVNWRRFRDWGYEVSDAGLVRSMRTGNLLRGSVVRGGYVQVRLSDRSRSARFKVHRLVLETFVSPPPRGHQVNHKNGDKKDNTLANLEWVTPSANVLHAYRVLGRIRVRSNQKLTADEVRAIRMMRASGIPTAATAEHFGVDASYVRALVRRSKRDDVL